jgi:hypothetical protein
MKRTRFASLALFVVAMSCRDAAAPKRDLMSLEEAHLRWRAQNLHTYAFTFQRSCFCMNVRPLHVVVVDDTVASVLDLQTGAPVDKRSGETVEDLFAFIRNAFASHAELIHAEYDHAKGFPTEIDYDGDAHLADDEIYYRVSDVNPVQPLE